MTGFGQLDSEKLDELEQKLWDILDNFTYDTDPPPIETLLAPENECDFHAETLETYARALIDDQAEGWQNHALLKHLDTCSVCRERLDDILAAYAEEAMPRTRGADIDITLFPAQLPDDASESVRGALDERRPVLLSAGFFEKPPDWHYSLEQVVASDDGRPGLLLTVVSPKGAAAGVDVQLVLLGQIFHMTTDENGQVFFPNVLVDPADDPLVPTLYVSLRVPHPLTP